MLYNGPNSQGISRSLYFHIAFITSLIISVRWHLTWKVKKVWLKGMKWLSNVVTLMESSTFWCHEGHRHPTTPEKPKEELWWKLPLRCSSSVKLLLLLPREKKCQKNQISWGKSKLAGNCYIAFSLYFLSYFHVTWKVKTKPGAKISSWQLGVNLAAESKSLCWPFILISLRLSLGSICLLSLD